MSSDDKMSSESWRYLFRNSVGSATRVSPVTDYKGIHMYGHRGGGEECERLLVLTSCQKKVKEIIVLIKARSFLDELNLEHLTS